MTRKEEIQMQAEKKTLEPSRLMHPYAKQHKVMSAYEIGFIEGGSGLPLRMMNELLGDLGHAIEEGGGSKFKVTIDVERYDLAARTTEYDKGGKE